MMGMDIPEKAVDAAVDALVGSRLGDHKGINGEEFVEAARAALEAAAPHMLAEAFSYGWREGAGIAAPSDLDTGEPMHDQAAQPACNPYRTQP